MFIPDFKMGFVINSYRMFWAKLKSVLHFVDDQIDFFYTQFLNPNYALELRYEAWKANKISDFVS
jgi:hypothetical protein